MPCLLASPHCSARRAWGLEGGPRPGGLLGVGYFPGAVMGGSPVEEGLGWVIPAPPPQQGGHGGAAQPWEAASPATHLCPPRGCVGCPCPTAPPSAQPCLLGERAYPTPSPPPSPLPPTYLFSFSHRCCLPLPWPPQRPPSCWGWCCPAPWPGPPPSAPPASPCPTQVRGGGGAARVVRRAHGLPVAAVRGGMWHESHVRAKRASTVRDVCRDVPVNTCSWAPLHTRVRASSRAAEPHAVSLGGTWCGGTHGAPPQPPLAGDSGIRLPGRPQGAAFPEELKIPRMPSRAELPPPPLSCNTPTLCAMHQDQPPHCAMHQPARQWAGNPPSRAKHHPVMQCIRTSPHPLCNAPSSRAMQGAVGGCPPPLSQSPPGRI